MSFQLERFRKTEALWISYLSDPSKWFDQRSTKISSKLPDFMHAITGESLWVDGWYNPPWLNKELCRNGLVLATMEKTKKNILKDDNEEQTAKMIVVSLKSCGEQKNMHQGSIIHAQILKTGLLQKNLFVGNSLISMYVKCGALFKAEEVLEELPVRDVVSWASLIAGYAQRRHGYKALDCYEKMQNEGIAANPVAFISILKACGSVRALETGKQIHKEIADLGFLKDNVLLGSALVDMYAKCGAFGIAKEVLQSLHIRDVVSWSALISGYAEYGYGKEAFECLDLMQREGLCPDAVTFACILKACASQKSIEEGRLTHIEITNLGLLGESLILGTALVDLYAKCGALAEAADVHHKLALRDGVTWSALISGYVQHAQGNKALNCFEDMKHKGFSPNAVILASALKACASIGALDKGKQIHLEIDKQGLLQALGGALVHMYVKCGAFSKARDVLNKLPNRDVVSWTALIAGYAEQGQGLEAVDCFEQMEHEGIIPNSITFVCLLKACSHSGLWEKGKLYFSRMKTFYGIQPASEHLTCMVDLFARTGHIDDAIKVIKKMPCSDHLPVWSALLVACRKLGNVTIGRWAFNHAVQLDRNDASAYVCMRSLYEAVGMKEEANKIEALRLENGTF